MSDEPADDEPSPFSLAPSARPPTSEDIRMQVRVPPPSRSGEEADLEWAEPVPTPAMASVGEAAIAETETETKSETEAEAETETEALGHAATIAIPTPVEPVAAAAPAPFAPAEPAQDPEAAHAGLSTSGRKRMIVALAGGGLTLVAVTGVVLAMCSGAPNAAAVASGAPSASADEPPGASVTPPSETTAETPATTPTTAAATSSAPAAPSKTKPAPRPKPFDRAAAKANLDALAGSVATCKVPKGSACQVKLTFAPTGHVSKAAPAGKCAGTAHGSCVATRLKKASVAPFSGKPAAYAYTYTAKAK